MLELRSVRAIIVSPIGTATVVAYADNEDSRLSDTMMSDRDCQRVIVSLSMSQIPQRLYHTCCVIERRL